MLMLVYEGNRLQADILYKFWGTAYLSNLPRFCRRGRNRKVLQFAGTDCLVTNRIAYCTEFGCEGDGQVYGSLFKENSVIFL